MSKKEFIDQNRPAEIEYHELLDLADTLEVPSFVQMLEQVMKADPYFMDSHLLMIELLNEGGQEKKAQRLLDEAFSRSIELITDKNKNWPKRLSWGFTENRHIIRMIFNKATDLWHQKDTEPALELLRNLLKSNPNDNIGARYYILAIRMGIDFQKFENRFNKNGYYDDELIRWFDKHAISYPNEFDTWFQIIRKDSELL
ncbi:hypothetical protein QLX67_02295 [Balneolaceae bacterium ANBcel3]|nr:hypothetical protein [Balneolaceae bacterium ANBcel3]